MTWTSYNKKLLAQPSGVILMAASSIQSQWRTTSLFSFFEFCKIRTKKVFLRQLFFFGVVFVIPNRNWKNTSTHHTIMKANECNCMHDRCACMAFEFCLPVRVCCYTIKIIDIKNRNCQAEFIIVHSHQFVSFLIILSRSMVLFEMSHESTHGTPFTFLIQIQTSTIIKHTTSSE